GCKCECLTIRAPRWLNLCFAVVRQSCHAVGCNFIQVQITDAACESRKGNGASIGTPRWICHGTNTFDTQPLLHTPSARVQDVEFLVSLRKHNDSDALAIRRPATCRVDETQRVEVRVACNVRELANDPAC